MPTLPDLLEPLSYEEILTANVERAKEMLPGYTPAQGDDIMIVLQAFSFREMLLRELIQQNAEGSYLSTATGARLDHLAETYYGIYRLAGARPWTTAEFALSVPLSYDVTIPEGYTLVDDGGLYSAVTREELVIPAGETSVIGVIELEREMATSSVRTEIPVTPIPYLSVSQQGDFAGGSDPEDDESFRERIRLSLSDKSTAGAERTYLSFTYAADERVRDVSVTSPSAGEVRVVYWSEEMDDVMQDRIADALNAKDVRPLTDHVTVAPAEEVAVEVSATLVIRPDTDAAEVLAAARDRLSELGANPQIGRDVHPSQIIAALMVDGVERVDLTAPTDTVTITTDQVAIVRDGGLSTQESSDEW